MQNVEGAKVGGARTLRGRPSSTREGWEAAREADAADLNRLLDEGGEIDVYVVPLWSNGDAERCLRELGGFDDVRVYVVPNSDDLDVVLAALVETDFGLCGQSEPLSPPGERGRGEGLAALIHAAASLDVPLLLPDLDPAVALRSLALAIADDLSIREIEAVLGGGPAGEPDDESVERARDLLS